VLAAASTVGYVRLPSLQRDRRQPTAVNTLMEDIRRYVRAVGFIDPGKYCYRRFRPITERHQCREAGGGYQLGAALPPPRVSGRRAGGALALGARWRSGRAGARGAAYGRGARADAEGGAGTAAFLSKPRCAQAVLVRPGPDVTRALAAGCSPPGAARLRPPGPAGMRNVGRELLAERGGVLGVQVDLIAGALEREPDSLLARAAGRSPSRYRTWPDPDTVRTRYGKLLISAPSQPAGKNAGATRITRVLSVLYRPGRVRAESRVRHRLDVARRRRASMFSSA
jgi:hypothetical protein